MAKDMKIDEAMLERKLEAEVEKYEKDYGSLIEQVANARKELFGEEWNRFHTWALGTYLRVWEEMIPVLEEDATTRNLLGPIIKQRLDFVAAQYAGLPITFLASVQPMTEEVGVVYFRQLKAATTRGGVTKGDVLLSTTGKLASEVAEYYSEEVTTSVGTIDTGGADPNTFDVTLEHPVVARTVTIDVGGGKKKAVDDGEGHILGVDIQGTINYETGELHVEVKLSGLENGDAVTATYSQNLAEASEVPGFVWELVGTEIRARGFLLQALYNRISNAVVARKLGRALDEDIAADVAAQINAAVMTAALKSVVTEATKAARTVEWDASPPSGVSVAEHRKTFPDAVEAAATLMGEATGRSVVSFIIAGTYGRRILRSLGVNLNYQVQQGPYLAGYWDGIPVYSATKSLIDDDRVVVGYKGPSWFEAPMVYAPFIPVLTVTGTTGGNVFRQATGVAHLAGLKIVVPDFLASVRITNM